MHRDENLLFGVFAVQLKLVTPSQIMEAAGAWATEPAKAIPERLVDAGAISFSDRQMIESLIERAVEAHGGNVGETLATFGGIEQVERSFFGSIVMSKSGEVTKARAGLAPFAAGEAGSTPGVEEAPGRYTRESEHARGGMGRVLLVHDEHLGRDIALKELMPRRPDETDSDQPSPVLLAAPYVARFLQEARITSQLEHPSVVPVYELGHREDGTLYYTMKLVRGRALSEAIREARTLRGRLALLPHFVDLCQAMAYAHSRGVIHRDIKPDNIMVGEFGETVVIDWGLAKARGREDVHADGLKESLRTMSLGDEEDTMKTAYGHAMGTPAYMPPEQAKGQLEEIDERSDVYSLGAVLYEVLTGKPPFEGQDLGEILAKVIRDEPVPVEELEPEAPPELIAICGRAMQKNSYWRYESARQIADDVQRFQAGAMVQAYVYPFYEHLRRFAYRHRAILTTSSAALLVLAVGAVFAYARVVDERDTAIDARRAESEARQNEEASRLQALEDRDRALDAQREAERSAYYSNVLTAQALIDNGEFSAAQEALWQTREDLRGWEWGYLLRLCNRDVLTIHNASGRVTAIDISPDGTQIIIGAEARGAQLFDYPSGKPLANIEYDWDMMETVKFSADGTQVLLAGDEGVAVLHDRETGEALQVFGGFAGSIFRHADISPDGRWVGAADDNVHVLIFSARTGELVKFLEGHQDEIRDVSFDPASERLASASADGTARIWDVLSGELLLEIDGHGASVRSVNFSPDGARLLTGSADRTARVWDANNGDELLLLEGHTETVRGTAFSPDASRILTISADKTARMWDAETGEEIAVYRGHSHSIVGSAFIADGSAFVTCSHDGTVKVWNTNIAETDYLRRLGAGAERTWSASFSPDGKSALVVWTNLGRRDDAVAILDVETGAERAVFSGFGLSTSMARMAPDGEHIAAASLTKTITMLDAASGSIVNILRGHTAEIEDVQFSLDGKRLISASWDGTAIIWDAQSGDILHRLEGHTDWVGSASFSRDGSKVVTTSRNGTTKLWNAETGEELHSLRDAGGAPVLCAEFSADGGLVFTGGHGLNLLVWDTETGELLASIPMHSGALHDLALSPDGKRLASASWGGPVKILDAGSFRDLITLTGTDDAINDVEWSPDGTQLISSGDDGYFTVWEAHPWTPDGLPGDSASDWEARYKVFKKLPDRRESVDSESEPVVHHVVTTRPRVMERLDRIAQYLTARTEAPQANPAPQGLPVEIDGLFIVLRLLGFQPGDVLLAIGETTFDDAEAAREQIEALEAVDLDGLQWRLERNGKTRAVTFEFVEPVITNVEGSMTHEQMIRILDSVPIFRAIQPSLEEDLRIRAEGFDLPPVDGRVNGILITRRFYDAGSVDDQALGQIGADFFLQFGLEEQDRVRSANGIAMDNLDAFLEVLLMGNSSIRFRQPYTYTIEVERSIFEEVHMTLNILPPPQN